MVEATASPELKTSEVQLPPAVREALQRAQCEGEVRLAVASDLDADGYFGERWLAAADTTFRIPTCGFSGSLNLSVAVALTLYDRLLGRPGACLPPGDLEETEKAALRAAWYAELAHGSPERQSEYADWLAHPVEPRPSFGVDRRRRQAPSPTPPETPT